MNLDTIKSCWTPKKGRREKDLDKEKDKEKEEKSFQGNNVEIPPFENSESGGTFDETEEDIDSQSLDSEPATKQNKINRTREIFTLLGVLFRDDIATAGEDFRALNSHSKLRKTNPGTILPKEEIEMALHYMKFASASYGWKLVYGLEPKKNLGIFQCLARTSRANIDGICLHTGIQKEDILMRTAKTRGMIPGFYLALDHKTKSLVLAIRGTQTISDTLTDLVASAHPFLNEWAHKGMVYSALRLQEKIQGVVTEALTKHPDYKMVFVGHSLGAGIATILTFLYRGEDPNAPVFCYAYAPPCTVSQKLAIMGRGYIRSYIFGDDVIPRLTYNSIQQIRAMLSFSGLKKSSEKRRLLMTRCISEAKATTYPPSPVQFHGCDNDAPETLLGNQSLKESGLEEEIIVSEEGVKSIIFDDTDGAIAESILIEEEGLGESTKTTQLEGEKEKETEVETEVKVPQVELGPEQTLEIQFTEKEAQTLFPAGVIYHMIPASVDEDEENIGDDEMQQQQPQAEKTSPEKKEKSHWWTRKKKKRMIKTTEMLYWELEHIIFSLNMFNHHLPPFYEYAFRRLLHQAQKSKDNKPQAPTLTQRMLASVPRWN